MTNPQPQNKPLFKKISVKKKKTGRIGSTSCCSSDLLDQNPSIDESVADIPTSTIDVAIRDKRRKRELKDQAMKRHGVALRNRKYSLPSDMVRSSIDSTLSHSNINNSSESDGMSRITLSWNKNDEKVNSKEQELEDSTALGRKQKMAMEEFIHKQMEKSNVESETLTREATMKASSSEALYQELHSKIVSRGEDAAGNVVTFTSPGADILLNQDVGAGGAMLGGTGIAEVLLPIDYRIGVIRDTQEAVIQKMNDNNAGIPSGSSDEKRTENLESSLPTSFNSGPSKRRCLYPSRIEDPSFEFHSSMKPLYLSETPRNRHSSSSAGGDVLSIDIAAVSASYSHNFQLHSHEWISRRKQEQDLELLRQRSYRDGTACDRERVGFAGLRGKEQPLLYQICETSSGISAPNESSRKRTNQSNDDRVWSSFVKYQKERGGKRR